MPKDFYCTKCDSGPYMDGGTCPVCHALLEPLDSFDGSSDNARYSKRQLQEADEYDPYDELEEGYVDEEEIRASEYDDEE